MSSPSTADSPKPNKFIDISEGKYAVCSISGREAGSESSDDSKAYGTDRLEDCIGVYMRVTENYFFIGHAVNKMPTQIRDMLKPFDKQLDDKKARQQLEDHINDIFGKEMTRIIRKGLQKFDANLSKDWNPKDAEKLMKKTLTLCYKHEGHQENDVRHVLPTFKAALEKWAGVGVQHEVQKYTGETPRDRMSGFVIIDPSNEETVPVWTTATRSQRHLRQYQNYDGSQQWKGDITWGDGDFSIPTLFGADLP